MSDEAGPEADGDLVRVDLPADSEAPGRARRATREALDGWQLSALVDSVVLVVSELVTNSVRYGRPPLHMVLTRRSQSVRVDVHDAVPAAPPLGDDPTSVDAESGRGLLIVTAVADSVGVERVPGDGKHVFASFRT